MEAIKAVTHKIGDVGSQVGDAMNKYVAHPLGFDFDPFAGTIFVCSGNGVIGHRVALKLLHAGYPHVRVGTRNQDTLSNLNKLGAEIADFSWDLEDTFSKALVGVKTVFCTMPHVNDWDLRYKAFLDACQVANVQHVVRVSFYHARRPGDPFREIPLAKRHAYCDQMLMATGINYAILCPSHLMSNPLVYQGFNLRSAMKPAAFYGSSHNRGVNYVSPNDVAEVAVRVLLAPRDHQLKEYTLTGPKAITDQEVASLLGRHLDKPVMYVDQPLHTFAEEECVGGDPKWLVADRIALEKIKASGKEEDVSFVSTDIPRLCGHPAETFWEYLLATENMIPAELP